MKSCMSLQCAHRDIEKKSNKKSEFGIPSRHSYCNQGEIVHYLIQMADPMYYGEFICNQVQKKQPIQGQQSRSLVVSRI